MSNGIDWAIFDRYFSGESPLSEVAAIKRWVAADPAHAAEMAAARRIWEEAGVVRPRFDVQTARARVRAKMAQSGAEASARGPRFVLPTANRRAWALAAGLAALLAGATVWQVGRPAARPGTEVATTREYVTSRGQRSEFWLPDGTRVMLGPESRLTIAATYGAQARDVRLQGQGYFDVVHDERRPFAVYAGGTVARDLGTKFDVRAYAAERRVRVVVAEGEVALGARVLSPREVGERAADGRIAVRGNVDLDRYLAWTGGRLVFEDMPLAEALPELSRWYNLDFRLADSALARLPLTVTLEDRLGAETLGLLALSLGVSIERRGRVVVVGQ